MTGLHMEHKTGDPPLAPPGTQFNQFIINKMLALGGFGQVFDATKIGGTDDQIIVKLESTRAKIQLLYNETSCLRTLNQVYNPYKECGNEPFLKYYGYGMLGDLRFLVMEKCGANLRDLKAATTLNRFSVLTSLWIFYKMISALEKMHNVGWLHRDVKPANFCIGLTNQKILYALDFGMSRCYVAEDGSLKPRKISAPFHGTLRYVSLNIHRRQDASRWDDIWSAYYIAVENMVGFLPWRRLGSVEAVMKTKATSDLKCLRYGRETGQPRSVEIAHNYLSTSIENDSYFYTPPPYKLLLQEINNDVAQRNANLNTITLDWQNVQIPPTYQYHHQQHHKKSLRGSVDRFQGGDRSVRFY